MNGLSGPATAPPADLQDAPVCRAEPGCITCGDVAVVLTVRSSTGDDAVCHDETGATELVATELIGPVVPGDRVLVHAGVALERLAPERPDPERPDPERPDPERPDPGRLDLDRLNPARTER